MVKYDLTMLNIIGFTKNNAEVDNKPENRTY